MADGFVQLRAGEKRPVFAQAAAASGTITLSGAGTVTLYDSTGAVVTGWSGVPATGYDTGAQAAPRVWIDVDTTTPTALAAGFYSLVFAFSGTGSDGIARTFEAEIEVQVLAVP